MCKTPLKSIQVKHDTCLLKENFFLLAENCMLKSLYGEK